MPGNKISRTVCALFAMMIALPAFAATPCADNYKPYSFQGTVGEIGTTADHRPFYVITNIPNAACGDEHQQIKAYPLTPVADSAVGKHVRATGIYTKSCVNVASRSFCLA